MPKNLHAGTFKWFWAVLPGQNVMVTFVHSDADATDDTDDADDYNRVIGIAQLKAFSCAEHWKCTDISIYW